MSDLIFYLKGAFDGDGHYSKQNSIIINLIDYDFLKEIQQAIKLEFKKHVNIRPTKVYAPRGL